jgi:hypothetical protein
MNQIGILYKEDGRCVICNLIIEIESELYISHNVRINRDEIFDLAAYGKEVNQIILNRLKTDSFRKMTIQEIYEASQQSESLSHLITYLRDRKIDDLLN